MNTEEQKVQVRNLMERVSEADSLMRRLWIEAKGLKEDGVSLPPALVPMLWVAQQAAWETWHTSWKHDNNLEA